jgi:hypothetical protein
MAVWFNYFILCVIDIDIDNNAAYLSPTKVI